MPIARSRCPKRNRPIKRGHIPDAGQVLGSSWAPGAPRPRRFLGSVRYDGRTLVPLDAWRCSACGYVELYARGS